MRRFALAVAAGILTGACVGSSPGLLLGGDLNSEARVWFEDGDTEASSPLLVFDPSRHRMDIAISMDEATEGLALVLVTESGSRYQILGSFHRCRTDGERRECDRWLPALPAESVGSWRIEASRAAGASTAAVDVKVTWIPIGS